MKRSLAESTAKTTLQTTQSILNMDKIYSSVWDKLPDKDDEYTHCYSIGVIKKPKPMDMELELQYQDIDIEGTTIALNQALTPFDKMVHGAIESIYITHYEATGVTAVPMSPNMIYRVMSANYRSHATSAFESKINDSIEKMRHIFLTITPSLELQKEKPSITSVNGAMISADRIEATVQGQKGIYWCISNLPLLYRVSNFWNQIARVPLACLDCHNYARFTPELGEIRQYLTTRIEQMKHRTYKNNGILMSTLYNELLGTQYPDAKTREKYIGPKGKIPRILRAFKENHYIADFSFETGPRKTVTKINIQIPASPTGITLGS